MSLSRSDRRRSLRGKRRKTFATISTISLLLLAFAGVIFFMDADGDRPQTLPDEPTPIDRSADEHAKEPPRSGNGSNKEQQTNEHINLSFVGDVMWASTVEGVLSQKGYDYPYIHVKPFLQKADLTIANLETPITERGEGFKKQYVYRSSPKALPAFKDAGFDIVNLANNHILDYGVQGLLDTLTHLDQAQIKHIGAGRNGQEAYQHLVIEKNGIKVAFLGVSRVVPANSWKAGKHPGVAETYNANPPIESIKRAKAEADLVVVVAHWGEERKDAPVKHQTDLAHQFIDAGADLVVGGHPHVLQGFEQYKDKWIAYSLGNFIFTMNPDAKTWESIILEASCSTKGGCDLHLVPIITKLANPQPMSEEDGVKLFARLTQISMNAIVTREGKVQREASPKEEKKR